MTTTTKAVHIETTRAWLSYLLRALWRRIDWEAFQQSRKRGIAEEMTAQLLPIAVSERSTLAWVRALATRFEVALTAGERFNWPASALLPRALVPDGMVSDEVADPKDHTVIDDSVRRVRWDVLTRWIDFGHLRLLVHENPAFFVTFASADPVDGEEALFDLDAKPLTAAGTWKPRLPGEMIAPRYYRAVWTCASPIHHGADEKSGNVSMFRRQRLVSPIDGSVYLTCFLSGNAIRGMWRDMAFARICELLGIKPQDLPPARAHAFFAGGSIETGADTQRVNVAARRRARDLCPPWALLAGCIDDQIMRGLLHVHDVSVICRENAWMHHSVLAPELPFEDYAASLKPVDELTQLRLLTRHAHRDFEDSDGVQMLANTEALLPGTQLLHSFHVYAIDGVSTLAKSCLSDLLTEFRGTAVIGAQTSRGYGHVAFDGYIPGPGAEALPDGSEYLAFVEQNRAQILDWAMRRGGDEPAGGGEERPATAKKGRGAGKRAAVAAPDPKAEADVTAATDAGAL